MRRSWVDAFITKVGFALFFFSLVINNFCRFFEFFSTLAELEVS